MSDFRWKHFGSVHVQYYKRNGYGELSNQVQEYIYDDRVFWDERNRNAQNTAHQERGTLRLSPTTVVHDLDHQEQRWDFDKAAQNEVPIPVSHY